MKIPSLLIGNKSESKFLSELKDPFTKNGVDSIRIRIYKDWNGNIQFKSYIDFKNGRTSGQQELTGENFVELVSKVEGFIRELR